jgi:hypothetical protein
MKTFHCTHCQNLVFFENVRCLNCGNALAYLPERMIMAALKQGSDGLWRQEARRTPELAYRQCFNYATHNVCNWAVNANDPEELCLSCRLTRVIPDLSKAGNREAWYKLETAKRRLIYTLLSLRLPLASKTETTPDGLAFEFLQDTPKPEGDRGRVFTGHDNGLITINVAEADDIYRERQRIQQHEPYRTLLGHFRHEIGHYYWDRLIHRSARLEAFRELFGDERESYQEALKRHYEYGAPSDWEQRFISAYATMHPWEDWAESWAHFMHMLDALETAEAVGLSLRPPREDEPSLSLDTRLAARPRDFERLVQEWIPLTYVLNNLSRGLGLPDSYPFVLSSAVVQKLRFIHETVRENGVQSSAIAA